ncbi:copper resistance protein B [Rhodothermus profundi]|uniref:Copper resistance protein B n=1 Tax=Rhodothermus profundi TaxID=633813 RepID=A0A1M6SS03_9BACT|nr:copper resistance protein B [Rhodothermus profundi]SHK47439.1 copper resistance protein B [Rhodothermus profundi]
MMRPIFSLLLVLGLGLSGRPLWAQTQPLIHFANENTLAFILFDLLETQPRLEGRPVQWDLDAWVGKMYNRLWIRSEGEALTSQQGGEAEFQALYSRVIAPFWDLQIGVRMDVAYGEETRTRAHLVFGLEGLAPYWFEFEPLFYVSQDGDLAASLVASHDLFITQRLILQPRLEMLAAAQNVPEWGIGRGLNRIDFGLRLRFELVREFAPYIGFNWSRLYGSAASLARREGEAARTSGIVAGVRLWY